MTPMSPTTARLASAARPTTPNSADCRVPAAHPRTFRTRFRYVDRNSKAEYVWIKYEALLRGRTILDVGADRCQLKQFIDAETRYWGIGLGGEPDQEVDLEQGVLPFEDNSFDCVLCLDVLEHLERIHDIFDELCRVTRRHVIVSLPNPWREFFQTLRSTARPPDAPMKFYGLPLERPADRHRWFFHHEEAIRFIRHRAARCGMNVVQIDWDGMHEMNWFKRLRRRLRMFWLRWDLPVDVFYAGTVWAVLEKPDAA